MASAKAKDVREDVVEDTGTSLATRTTSPPALASFAVSQGDVGQMLEAIRENVAGTVREFDFPQIKMPAGGGLSWEIPSIEGVGTERTLQCVVLYSKQARAYWETSMDESGGGTPPDCESKDCLTGVGKPGGDCTHCPLAEFGTARKGSGQACKQMRVMFLLLPGSLIPYRLAAPPTSLGALSNFFLGMAGKAITYHKALVSFSLEKVAGKGTPDYSRIVPKLVSRISDTEIGMIEKLRAGMLPAFDQAKVTAADYTAG